MATGGAGRPRFDELTGPDAAIVDGEPPATSGDVPSAAQTQDRVVPDRLVGLLDPQLRSLRHDTERTVQRTCHVAGRIDARVMHQGFRPVREMF